ELVENILLVNLFVLQSQALVEFTNVKCEALDREFASFDYCLLKSINRTYKYVTLKNRVFQVPITDVKVNIAMYKRLNGLKPFLYNVTVDACKFLKNPKSSPVGSYFYGFFKSYSNMNHSCPFDHDLIVDKVSATDMNHRITRVLPFPEGSYMFQSDWYAQDIKRAEVKLYLTLS
ncbi:hypothetical protein KR059_001646, partial [Drosophila kikkawai]